MWSAETLLTSPGLPLQIEAPAMTSNGVAFSFLVLFFLFHCSL